MWISLEGWQCRQLECLAQNDPERAETILNTLWNVSPGLLDELAIAAVDQEALSVSRAAEILRVSLDEVEQRLIVYRRHALTVERAVVNGEGCGNGAKLAEGKVAVWEIIREYRKLGSVQRLRESFPSLSEGELAAAFVYADKHPAEIQERIDAYEHVRARRRIEYPFAG